jgi:hypothetical protein
MTTMTTTMATSIGACQITVRLFDRFVAIVAMVYS